MKFGIDAARRIGGRLLSADHDLPSAILLEDITGQSKGAKMSLVRVLAALFSFFMLGGNAPAPLMTGEIASKVISCFKGGSDTISAMYSCSGVWVTPRILTLCFLEADCPVIPDTIDARQIVAAATGGTEKLEQKLSIDLANALELPNRTILDECRKSVGDEDAFINCVSKRMISPALAPLISCATMQSDRDKALCLTKDSPKEFASVIECVSNRVVNTTALQECTKQLAWEKVKAVGSCVEEVTSSSGKVDCLLTGLDPAQKSLGQCLSGSTDHPANAVVCLGKLDPQAASKIEQLACAATAGADQTALMGCFANSIKGDEGKLAACATGDRAKLASCVLGIRPEYKAAAQVVACAQGGRDAGSLVANCSDSLIKDERTRAVLACATKAGSDTQKLAGCAASSVFPPEIARYAVCATTSQGPTSFALCAAGPMMNEEWRIAAECAVSSGGEPFSFAGCTAGRLTLRELTKCFSGASCFGPNNMVVKAYTNAFNDMIYGPGRNNEFVVALTRLEDLSGGKNSLINNPDQLLGGKNSVFHNPGQILGGEKSVTNQILTKPFGGDHSVPNVVAKGGERVVQDAAKGAEHLGQEAGKAGDKLRQTLEKVLPKLPKIRF